MRVLHLGNLVNNGYLNAKFLRAAGVEADVVADESHVISQPEWEEVDVETPSDHFSALDVPAAWTRPPWVLPIHDPAAARRFRGQRWLEFRALLARNAPRLRVLHRSLRREYEPLRSVLGAPLTTRDLAYALRISWYVRLLLDRPLTPLFRAYDLIEAYAAHPIIPLVVAPERPYVAYEHGTLREIPYEPTPRGRLMSLAYRLADRVVITNADVHTSALRLGLDNVVFIPHIIDEKKYVAGPSPLGDRLRREGADFVVVSVTRHDWHEKGNDVMISAFATLTKERPQAVLVLTEWGEEIDRSKRLIADLGVARNVEWMAPLSKRRLIDAYRAADVVLDQFVIGTFGGIAPEAMSCGTPVAMAFDAAIHAWCFSELPPILDARTSEQLAHHLIALSADETFRERVGRESREWICAHHSSRVVVDRHVRMYEEILANPRVRNLKGVAL